MVKKGGKISMNQIKFPQQSRNWAIIENIDMRLYRVYGGGLLETMSVPSVQDGLKQVPFIRPDIVILKFSVPHIVGYKINLVEKTKDSTKVSLVYLIR